MTTALPPSTHEIAVGLAECDPGEVLALLIPYQRQDDRARAINHFDGVVRQLRAAGWELRTAIDRCPEGEAYSIEPVRPPTNPAPHQRADHHTTGGAS